MKQAEALIAEQQNDVPQAFALLREAAKLSPDDIDIAFDLANLALEHPDQAQPADFDAYLRLEAITANQRLLRAYVLAARGRTDEARVEAQSAAAADPANQEAHGLVQALTPADSGEAPGARPIVGRVRLYGQYDTNVSVLPDRTTTSVGAGPTLSDATNLQRAAVGIGVQGDVRWTPVRGVTELSFLGGLSFLGNLSGRESETVPMRDLDGNPIRDGDGNAVTSERAGSKTYDFGTIDLSARLAFPRERWSSAIELYGSSVFINDFSERYLTEGTLLASSNVAVNAPKSIRVGAYGLGGIRSFGADFSARDGTRAEGGLTLDYITRNVGAGLRAGYQAELADGDQFTENGPLALLYARGSTGRFDALLALVYQMRNYNRFEGATGTSFDRTDNRFGPQLQVSYGVTEILSVVGTYQYTRNASKTEGYTSDFDYTRHLATMGIEARL